MTAGTTDSSERPAAGPPTPAAVRRPGEAAHPVQRRLRRVRRAAKTLVLLRAVCTTLAVLGALALGAILGDFVLRPPGGVRAVGLVGLVALAAWLTWKWVRPAWRFWPSLAAIAGRIERLAPAAHGAPQPSPAPPHTGLAHAGLLAAAAEFESPTGASLPADPTAEPLAQHLTERVRSRGAAHVAALPARAVDWRALRRPGLRLGAVAATALLGATLEPGLAWIGVQRLVAPWLNASWPARTDIADATGLSVHPIDESLPVRAALLRSSRGDREERVSVRHRLIDARGVPGPWRQAVLAAQPGEVEASGGEGRGRLYERLIDVAALGPTLGATTGAASGQIPGTDTSSAGASGGASGGGAADVLLEYELLSRDDRAGPTRVRLAHPPRLLGVRVDVTPPAYAAGAAGGVALQAADQPVPLGRDGRGVVGPIVAGSAVEVRLAFSKPVNPGEASPAWLAPLLEAAPGAAVRREGSGVIASGVLRAPAEIEVLPVDEHGFAAAAPATLVLDVRADATPAAAVIEPARDEAVLATATLPVAGEGRDEIGLAWVSLEARVARAVEGSPGAPPVPEEGDAAAVHTLARVEPTAGGAAAELRAEASLSVESLGPAPGDEIWLTALAADAAPAGDMSGDVAGDTSGDASGDGSADAGTPAATREPTRSAPRRLRVITEAQLVEEFRAELAAVRAATVRLDERQRGLVSQTARLARAAGEPTPEGDASAAADDASRLGREQAGLTGGVEQQARAIERLAQRAERNNLAEEALAETLRRAEEALTRAAEASSAASQQLSKAAAQQAQAGAESGAESGQAADRASEAAASGAVEASREAAASQQRVRDELGRLLESLDRGEDDWLARRALERLLEQQRQVLAETLEAQANAVGRELDELDAAQRAELDRVARQQAELAERAQAAVSRLDDAAEERREDDPVRASAMARAAQRARDAQLDEQLRKAAEDVANNRTAQAARAQEAAVEQIEDLLEEIDNAQAERDAVLRREASDLADRLERLAARQRGELDALAQARAGEREPGLLAGPMLALHTAVLDVRDEARGFDELAPVGDLIASAAASQAEALGALHAAPVNLDGAEPPEQRALADLLRAAEQAREAADDAAGREQERARRELRAAYRAALERQTGLRSRTEPLARAAGPEGQLGRRERRDVLTLGREQAELGGSLADLLSQTEGLADAVAFAFAHEQLDAVVYEAAATLTDGRATAGVIEQQTAAIGLLAGLIEALGTGGPKPDDRFANNEQGGGGGGGGAGGPQPLVQDIAQLRLLRAVQQQLAQQTRRAAEAGAAAAATAAALADRQRRLAEVADELVRALEQRPPAGAPGIPVQPDKPQPDKPQPDKPQPADAPAEPPEAPQDGDQEPQP